MKYSDLIAEKNNLGSIKAWVNHGIIPSEEIVRLAEALIYRTMRVREMRKLTAGTLLLDAVSFDTPDGLVEPIRLSLFNSAGIKCKLKQVEPHDLEDLISYMPDGKLPACIPQFYAMDDTKAYFHTRMDQEMNYRFWHYRRLPALSPLNQQNALTTKFPDILTQACLNFAFQYRQQNNDAIQAQNTMVALIQAANEQADELMADIHSEFEYA